MASPRPWDGVVSVLGDIGDDLHMAFRRVITGLQEGEEEVHLPPHVVQKRPVVFNWDGEKLEQLEKVFVAPELAEVPDRQVKSVGFFDALHNDPHMPEIKRVLAGIPITFGLDENSPKQLIILDSELTLNQALDELAQKNILSAPVRDHESGKVQGFFSVLDFLDYFLTQLQQSGDDLDLEKLFSSFGTLGKYLQHHKKSKKRVDSQWFPLRDDDNLYRLLQVFAWGVHRVAVLHAASGEFVNVISQSNVINLLVKEPRLLGAKAGTKLGDLHAIHFEPKGVVAVHPSTRTYAAFHHLLENKVSAVAVVDIEKSGSKKFLGSLSANMVKGLNKDNLHLLVKPVLEYIKEATPKGSEGVDSDEFATPCTTLLEALQKLSRSGRHRLWIVDNENDRNLLGVLSLTDIIGSVVQIGPGEMA